MQFDITVPWKNDTFLNCFLPSTHTETKATVTKDNLISKLTPVNTEGGKLYRFFQDLPQVVELTSEESAASAASAAASTPILSIPATSSSMMRYFIGQYLQDIAKEANLEKIQKLMFGPDILIEDPTGGPTVSDKQKIVMETITGYTTVFNSKYPADDNYEDQYGKIKEFSGGNRKTKRRRTNKKRRSQRKKRRSQRK
jgi:hypothetical protein